MEIKKNKELYEAPSTRVFEVKQRTQLLAGSGDDIPNSDPYTPGGDPFSF